jgi:DNA ligase (NAD+)
MNIDRVGEKNMETFVDKGLVKSFSDLYKLKKSDLMDLERQGEKSVQNILNSIQQSKNPSLGRFIYALGIRFVGEQTAKSLADHYESMDNFLKTSTDDLLAIDDIGPKVAESIQASLNLKSFTTEIHNLLKCGIQFQKISKKGGKLSGQTFVITGTLPVSRDKAKDFILSAGGKATGSVSQKTSFLLTGKDPGSKLNKAKKLGVKIISWDELQSMMK